jgi:serine/threonine protein kinase
MSGGSLDTLIEDGRAPPTEALVAKLMYQVLAALSYCHEQGIIPRDIKPENITLTQEATVFKSPDCKLIDFGIACQGKPGQVMKPYGVGTPSYMAPEMVRQQPYSAKADIWSLGVTAFELLAGCHPFGGSERSAHACPIDNFETFEDGEANLYSEGGYVSSFMWQLRSADARDFVRLCLDVNPAQRPTAAQALEHPWLQRHEPVQHRFTQDIAQSLSNYVSLPSIARCCLLIIATRVNVPNLEMLSSFFLGADADGDGKLSRDDLAGALADVQQSWWSWDNSVDIDAERVLSAADFSHKGAVGYTEFIAACTSARHGSFHELVRQAFFVLDTDRDGLVNIQQVRRLFRERDAPLLDTLPQCRPFNQTEWCECLGAYDNEDWPVQLETV